MKLLRCIKMREIMMSKNTAPPKVDKTNNHLANERTFLAWIRTSISIIVFGFVVAKFGLVLREFFLTQNRSINESNISMGMGVGFMVVGVVIALTSTFRYRMNMFNINAGKFKPTNMTAILLGVFTSLFGAVLVAYLILTVKSL